MFLALKDLERLIEFYDFFLKKCSEETEPSFQSEVHWRHWLSLLPLSSAISSFSIYHQSLFIRYHTNSNGTDPHFYSKIVILILYMYKMSAKKISNRKWINICISVMRCSITEKALVCKTYILRDKKTNELVMVLNIILPPTFTMCYHKGWLWSSFLGISYNFLCIYFSFSFIL